MKGYLKDAYPKKINLSLQHVFKIASILIGHAIVNIIYDILCNVQRKSCPIARG